MDNPILNEALSSIKVERIGEFKRSFDLVEQLLNIYGEENLAERLYAEIPSDCAWEVVADLYGILIWSMSDSGATSLIEDTERWLSENNDLRKIKIALNLDTYPFRNKAKMVEVLSSLANQHPEVSSKCEELIASRSKLKE